MRSMKYLNVILTINAGLLAILVWTQVAGRPVVAAAEAAANDPSPSGGIPNASEQRKLMIEALERVQQSVEASNRLLAEGELRVEVMNFHEMPTASGAAAPPPVAPASRGH